MRIAIITFHRAYNCGAMLQAWALKTVLKRMGHIVEFPVCNHVGETKRWQYNWANRGHKGIRFLRSIVGRVMINLMSVPCEDILRHRYERFRINNLPERDCVPEDFDKYYDLIIVGSDQVWSVRHTGADAPVFFAENIPACVRKIAYAASYGDKPLKDCADLKRVAASLDRFSAISTREPLAQTQLSLYTNRHIDVTLDPTLLLESKDYDAIATESAFCNGPYLFMYTLNTDHFFIHAAKTLAQRLGVKCIIAPCHQYSRYNAPSGIMYGISPDRLVGLAKNAKYILAASFHGTAMGVVFNKPFLSLRSQIDEYESRPAALLNSIGCGDRVVNPATSLDQMEMLLRNDVPSTAYALLDARRIESLRWIKENV